MPYCGWRRKRYGLGVGDFPADVESKNVQSRRRVNPPLYLEVFDRLLHLPGEDVEFLRGLLHGGGRFGDMVGDAGEVAHRAGGLFATAGDIAQAFGYVELGRVLLLDGGGDGRGELVDALDDGRELVYRVGRFAATVLDAADQMGDIIGRWR